MMPSLQEGGLLLVSPYKGVGEALSKYAGFDGILWPGSQQEKLEACLLDIGKIDCARKKSNKFPNSRILFVRRHSCHNTLNIGMEFIGFDVGIFETCYDKYSFIMNELIRDLIPDGDNFKVKLNMHCLFSNCADARDFLNKRLLCKDFGLEEVDDESPCIVEIYKV